VKVDSHVHFYDPTRPGGIPFPSVDDHLLYRKMMPQHLRDVSDLVGIGGVIVVEASRRMHDNLWIVDLASSEDSILGFTAGLDPASSDFEKNTLELISYSVFRGFRLRPGDMVNVTPQILDNIMLTGELGLCVDVLVGNEGLQPILSIVGEFPNLSFIVNHLCGLDVDGKNLESSEREILVELSSRSNVYCKVSAVQERAHGIEFRNNQDYFNLVMDRLWCSFGEDRLLYGSNWPVCERAGDYSSQFDITRSFFEKKGESACQKFYQSNCRDAYKLTIPSKSDAKDKL